MGKSLRNALSCFALKCKLGVNGNETEPKAFKLSGSTNTAGQSDVTKPLSLSVCENFHRMMKSRAVSFGVFLSIFRRLYTFVSLLSNSSSCTPNMLLNSDIRS